MNSIFVITYDPNPADEFSEITIAEEYGYYLTKEAAEEAVKRIDGPALARFEEAMQKFERSRGKWNEESAKARALGFRHASFPPSRPGKPLLHGVMEIEPAKEES